MKPTEVVDLVALVRQIAPAQNIDGYTADAWEPLLIGLRAEDALEAVYAVAGVQAFIAPADIIREVRRIRSGRVAVGPKFDPAAYPEIESDADELEAYRDHTRRLADGKPPREVPPTPTRRRDVAELLRPLVDRTRTDDLDAEEGL